MFHVAKTRSPKLFNFIFGLLDITFLVVVANPKIKVIFFLMPLYKLAFILIEVHSEVKLVGLM